VGFPIALLTAEEAKAPPSDRLIAFKTHSPYNRPVIKHDSTLNEPKRLSGLETLHALGWQNPLKDAAVSRSKEQAIAGSGVFPTGNNFRNLVDTSHRKSSSPQRGSSPSRSRETSVLPPRTVALTKVRLADEGTLKQASTRDSSLRESLSRALDSNALVGSGPFHPESLKFANSENRSPVSYPSLGTEAPFSIKGWGYTPLQESEQTLSADSAEKVKGATASYPQRGAVKPIMGEPVHAGEITRLLADPSVSVQELGRRTEKELLHLTHDSPGKKSVQSRSHPPSPGNSYFKDTQQAPSVSHQLTAASSAWSKLRSNVSSISGSKRLASHSGSEVSRHQDGDFGVHTVHMTKQKKDLDSRERPWPVTSKQHFKLQYSWLSQPMVQEAATQIYSEDAEQQRKRKEEEAKAAAAAKKKKKLPFLQKLKQYNKDDVSSISTLTDLKEFERITALNIRNERLQAKSLEHPYPWVVSVPQHPPEPTGGLA
jgi:hypothetical protein